VVLIADASGGQDIERIYEPFGADAEYILDVTVPSRMITYKHKREHFFTQLTGACKGG
jgi:hypothetical protein